MAEVASLLVRLTAETSGFKRGLQSAGSDLDSFAKLAGIAGKALTVGLTVPLAAVAAAAIVAVRDFDGLTRGLTAVTGSADEASKQIERLREVAKLPGLGLREAIQGAINLQAVGFSAAAAERALKAFGNAVATTGGGKAELDRVITQLTQMASAGKILTADLRPIIQVSPLVGRALKEAFGTIDASTIEGMGLSFDQFFDRLVTQLETLPKVTGGVGNAFENMSDVIFEARVAIGNALLPVLIPLVSKVSEFAKGLAGLNPLVVQWGVGIGAALALLGPALLAVSALTNAVIVLKGAAALGGLAAILTPAGAVLVGLGLLAAAFVLISQRGKEAQDTVAGFKDSLGGMDLQAIGKALVNLRVERSKLEAQIATESPQVGNRRPGERGVDAVHIAALNTQLGVMNEKITEAEAALARARTAAVALPPPFVAAGAAVADLKTNTFDLNDEIARQIGLLAEAQELGVATTFEFERAFRFQKVLSDELAKGNVTLEQRVFLQQQLNRISDVTGAGTTLSPRDVPGPSPIVSAKQITDSIKRVMDRVEAWIEGRGEVAEKTDVAGIIGASTSALSSVGGPVGTFVSSVGQVAGAFASGGALMGGIALAGVAIKGLSGLFDSGASAMKKFQESLRIAVQGLDAEFALLDIDDPVKQFARTLQQAQALFKGKSTESIFEGLTLENIQARIDAMAAAGANFGIDTENGRAAIEWLLKLETLGDSAERAADGLNKFSSSISNAPRAFNLALLRFNASAAGAPPVGGSGGLYDGPATPPGPTYSFTFEAGAIVAAQRTARELLEDISREAQRMASTGQTSRLGLALG